LPLGSGRVVVKSIVVRSYHELLLFAAAPIASNIPAATTCPLWLGRRLHGRGVDDFILVTRVDVASPCGIPGEMASGGLFGCSSRLFIALRALAIIIIVSHQLRR
jgi:hypothetical protein